MTRTSPREFPPILSSADPERAGMLNVTQPWFDNDMDQWGKTRGDEVHEGGQRLSRLLGPDGAPLVYPKARLGFDLTPRARRGA
jgi:hypothetical protein